MAKRTAIIDIGSNSTRMAIYEKDSRFSFHVIKEIKSRVRISEGAYNNHGNLQTPAIKRAINTLMEFSQIAKSLTCKKILCVATSAIRDAPNSDILIKEVKKKLGFDIKIIDGNKEAYLGGIAALNMLSNIKEATTVDIGGGSTEFAKIKNGKIIKTLSINLGTIRLKELFFDKKKPKDEIIDFIKSELNTLDNDFLSSNIIGIGGTIRALGKIYMNKISYPISTIHNFNCSIKDFLPMISKISASNTFNLQSLGVKKDRFDTIREGSIILEAIINKFKFTDIIISGVGVREGLFLTDLLRSHHNRFPSNFFLSLESLRNRFLKDRKESNFVAKSAGELFDVLSPIHQLDNCFRHELLIAGKLHSIGRVLNFYQEHLHASYFILNNLNYGFSHKEKLLISTIIKFHSKKITENDLKEFKEFLPDIKTLNWLIFLLTLSKILYTNCTNLQFKFEYNNHSLYIKTKTTLYIAKDLIKRIPKPCSFAIIIEEV